MIQWFDITLTAPPGMGDDEQWRPVHGDCTCPRNDDGEIEWHYEAGFVNFAGFRAWDETARSVTHYSDDCPLHSDASSHGDELTSEAPIA